MRNPDRRRAVTILVVAVFVVAVCAPVTAAWAAPSAAATIASKQAEADAARRKLEDMDAQLEMKVEEYNGVVEALDVTRAEILKTQQRLEVADRQLAESQARLGARVCGIYRSDTVDIVAVLLGTNSFDDFLSRVDTLTRISRSDAVVVGDVKELRLSVLAAETALESRQAEQTALRREIESRAKEIEAAAKRQGAYVATLDAEVQRLVKAEQERQRRLAAERARRALAASRKSYPAPRASGDLGAPHTAAVAAALRHLGVRYTWGGTSPSTGFDCSGLTQDAYRDLGITLPRTSRSQFKVGGFIPANRLDMLAPGDLVFFGYEGDPGRVHHVGMYVGNGDYVHAPGTGDQVKVSSLTDRIAARADYVGGVRP